jgi:hypothetical protein
MSFEIGGSVSNVCQLKISWQRPLYTVESWHGCQSHTLPQSMIPRSEIEWTFGGDRSIYIM